MLFLMDKHYQFKYKKYANKNEEVTVLCILKTTKLKRVFHKTASVLLQVIHACLLSLKTCKSIFCYNTI